MSTLRQKLGSLFLIEPHTPFYSEKARKVFLITAFAYIAIITLMFFAFDRYIKGYLFYSIILLGFVLVNFAFIVLFSFKTDKYKIASYILVGLMFLLALTLLIVFTPPVNGLFWQFVFVPMAFFLIGKNQGSFFSLILFTITVLFYIYHPNAETLDFGTFLRFSVSYWILIFFVYLFEYVRQRTHDSIKKNKNKISELLADSMQQNEEIKTQNEEIRAQSEQLEKANNELEKLSLVAKFTDNIVIILDKNGRFEWVNEGFERLLGYNVSDMPDNHRTLQHISSRDDILDIMEQCKDDGLSVNYESLQITADGKEIDFNTTITPLFDKEGKIKNFIIIDSNISLIKSVHKKLEELNATLQSKVEEEVTKNREKDIILLQQSRQAAMGEMISNIAHQWRQPLNAIGIIVQNLLEAYNYGEIDDKYLSQKIDKVMSLISYMSETIDDFRNFFKPEKKAQKFFVKEAVKKASSFVESSFKGLDIEIEFLSKNDPVAFGYPNEYMQVVINILNNARDALVENNVENPYVKVEVSSSEEGSCLRIFNNGSNIGKDIEDKIFDPYFSTKHKSRGTGLGLYMAKSIIENNMRGKLYFINKGDGVEFIIELPRSSDFD